MKIEPGRFYKTRGGSKVRIYAVDAGGAVCPVHGAIEIEGGTWEISAWMPNGSAYPNFAESYRDIVSEWDTRPFNGDQPSEQ